MRPFLAPVCVGSGPVSVLSRVMDQLIISAIPACFVPGVGARSEYLVTAGGIRGIIPAQTSDQAQAQSVVIVIIITEQTQNKKHSINPSQSVQLTI